MNFYPREIQAMISFLRISTDSAVKKPEYEKNCKSTYQNLHIQFKFNKFLSILYFLPAITTFDIKFLYVMSHDPYITNFKF